MSISETADSFLKALKERAANPFLGTFIVSWLIVNFKLFIVLVNDGSYYSKLSYISTNLYPNSEVQALKHVIYPIIGCSIYLFALAVPSRLFFIGWHKAQNALNLLRKKIDGSVLLTKTESIELKTENNQLKQLLLSDSSKHQDIVQNLIERTSQLENQNSLYRGLLIIPPMQLHKNNAKILGETGNLQKVLARERGAIWRIEIEQEKASEDGFEIELAFDSQHNLNLESIYIDIEKQDKRGTIRITHESGTIDIYDGTKEDETDHFRHLFSLAKPIITKRFSLRISGRSAHRLYYKISALNFYPPRVPQQLADYAQ